MRKARPSLSASHEHGAFVRTWMASVNQRMIRRQTPRCRAVVISILESTSRYSFAVVGPSACGKFGPCCALVSGLLLPAKVQGSQRLWQNGFSGAADDVRPSCSEAGPPLPRDTCGEECAVPAQTQVRPLWRADEQRARAIGDGRPGRLCRELPMELVGGMQQRSAVVARLPAPIQ